MRIPALWMKFSAAAIDSLQCPNIYPIEVKHHFQIVFQSVHLEFC